MTNELHQPDENTGTMEVLERHQFDVSNLKDYMHEHVEGFEAVSYTHLTLPTILLV